MKNRGGRIRNGRRSNKKRGREELEKGRMKDWKMGAEELEKGGRRIKKRRRRN